MSEQRTTTQQDQPQPSEERSASDESLRVHLGSVAVDRMQGAETLAQEIHDRSDRIRRTALGALVLLLLDAACLVLGVTHVACSRLLSLFEPPACEGNDELTVALTTGLASSTLVVLGALEAMHKRNSAAFQQFTQEVDWLKRVALTGRAGQQGSSTATEATQPPLPGDLEQSVEHRLTRAGYLTLASSTAADLPLVRRRTGTSIYAAASLAAVVIAVGLLVLR